MKQILTILLLIGLTVWGHLTIPHFDSYALMIGLISALVIAHELGHFFVAKRVGVKVERFGFGLPFGPTLLEKKIGETTFCLHPVLLGGYVSFPDDDPNSDIPLDSPKRFENQPILQRAAIAVAGVAVNFVLGYLIMVFVVSAWGYPTDYYVRVQELISPDSPATKAGLMPEDLLLKVGTREIKQPTDLIEYLAAHKEQAIPLVIERGSVQKTVEIVPNSQGKIEVKLSLYHKYTPLKNPIEILTKSYAFLQEKMVMNFQGLGEIFTGQRSMKELSGPIGIVVSGGEFIQVFGLSEGLVITAIISIVLAVMNILPIPMLDGGHLLFMLIEKIQGHPLKKEIQERVIQVSFVVLLGLMCLILWNDINIHILGGRN